MRRRGLIALAVLITGLAATPASALPPACSQSGTTVTCRYTSGSNPFAVPAGVSTPLKVVATGAAGGDSFVSTGGHGATVTGELPVTAGTTVFAVVGSSGAQTGGAGGGSAGGGFLSGGGGGSSDVRTNANDLSTRLLVAGGGGGVGGLSEWSLGFAHSFSGTSGQGGDAGGGNGADSPGAAAAAVAAPGPRWAPAEQPAPARATSRLHRSRRSARPVTPVSPV